MRKLHLLAAFVAMILACGSARAQEPAPAKAGPDLGGLAKSSQNPISNLNTIPVQWNFYSGGGLGTQSQSILNVQPVLPLALGKTWIVVSRTVIPIVDIPGAGGERFEGIADIQQQFFFTPASSGGFTWGAGPIFSFPTSNQAATETGQYAVGATAVMLKMGGPWVYGLLANNLWKVAGSDQTVPINDFFLQPFVNYNLSGGWAVSTVPGITADWEVDADQRWTVPVGLGISKVTVVGKLPINLLMQYYGFAVRPDGAPSGQMRMQFNLMFPVAK